MLAKIAALAGIEALIPPGDQTPSGITARFGADIVRYFPGRDARKIQCPGPLRGVRRRFAGAAGPHPAARAESPKGRGAHAARRALRHLRRHAFERNVSQQLDFLARHVPTGTGDAD